MSEAKPTVAFQSGDTATIEFTGYTDDGHFKATFDLQSGGDRNLLDESCAIIERLRAISPDTAQPREPREDKRTTAS